MQIKKPPQKINIPGRFFFAGASRIFLSSRPAFLGAVFVIINLLLSLLLPGTGFAQKHYDFNAPCQQAYREIVQLRLDAGRKILDSEKKRDPDNLIPFFLDNYIDFFILFFNEDPAEYESRKNKLDERLEQMDDGPQTSPFHLFTKSVIHFQWAAIKIKFGNNWDAGWEFRRSFLQSKENQKKFPDFTPSIMLSGAMQVVAGTIPDGYKWLSSLLGIKGDITTGMGQLDHFLGQNDPWAILYRDEAIFYFLYLKFYIENKRADVFVYIRQNRLDIKNNHLFAYLAANLGINDQQSAFVEQVIRQKNNAPEYLTMPVWDLEMGYASLYHLQPEAHIYLERFVRCFKGKFYVKDALQKLSWYYYLQGDEQKAGMFREQTIKKGGVDADADKQALKEAKSGIWPNKVLLKARLLSDGGYYGEALASLQGTKPGDFRLAEEKCEYTYRVGRVYDGLGKGNEAITAYLNTIRIGESLKEYYAARAALQMGYLYEQRGNLQEAIAYFQKCLSMKEHEYKNSLDQKAIAGIARCKGE
ncbi:tetratricopeptide repeat protein [Flavitalea flava]